MDHTIGHQLLLAKEFYERACADLRARGPFSAGLSASGLQDAIEMCLLAVAHELNVAGEKRFFKELWGDIESAAASRGKHLSRRGQMAAVNEMRVRFKHHGELPDREQVERFRSDTQAFLEETVADFFDIEFATLSEIDLLGEGPIRDSLRAAQAAIDANDVTAGLERCADALAAIRARMEPLYQAGIWVQFHNVPPAISQEIRLQARNLREQIIRVRELALGALFGLNVWDLRMIEALLPERQGTEYSWPEREMPVLPKSVGRCVSVLTRYAIAVDSYLASGDHPDWSVI